MTDEEKKKNKTLVLNLMHDTNNKVSLALNRVQFLKKKLGPEFNEEELKDLDLAIEAIKEIRIPLDKYYIKCKEEGFI